MTMHDFSHPFIKIPWETWIRIWTPWGTCDFLDLDITKEDAVSVYKVFKKKKDAFLYFIVNIIIFYYYYIFYFYSFFCFLKLS